MLTSKRVCKGLVLSLLAVLVILTTGTAFCKDAKTVAVVPFKMNSPQDLGFLQNGLFSMLSSRLSDPGKVDVLDRETVENALAEAQGSDLTKGDLNEAKARIIGANLGVDFVLFGSLTHFGESVSLDGSMVDVNGQKETLSFFEQSNSMGDVIPLVNSFAGDVNLKMFGRRINNELYAQPVPQEPPAPGGLHNAGGVSVYGGGLMTTRSQGFSTHFKMDDVIRGLSSGDVDKDGTVEVVAATDNQLFMYHFDGQMLVQEGSVELASHIKVVSLDVADINGNGYPEIFVTAMTVHKDTLASSVVEYNGSNYKILLEDQAVYYRVIQNEQHNNVLIGQNRDEDPFSGRIYTMSADGDQYNKVKRLRMPRGTNVLSLAKGPVVQDAWDEYLSINRHHRLVAIDAAGSELWSSTTKYGKSNTVWLMPQNDADASFRDRVYFNPRIIFHAMGDEEKPKAIVVKNSEVGGGMIGRYKRFKEGYIEMMEWNGIAMAPVFQTVPVQGWISDINLVDVDGDQVPELLVSVVGRTKMAILSKDKSTNIISYKLK